MNSLSLDLSRPRVLPDFEEIDRYDSEFYVDQLESAAELILRPFGFSLEKSSSSKGLVKFLDY